MTTKTQRNQQVKKINAKLDEINAKLKETSATVANKGFDAKDALDAKVAEAKTTVEDLKKRSRVNYELFRHDLIQKKDAHDAKKLAKYIDDLLSYSDECAELSLLFAAESKLAVLEALLAMEEYDEKFSLEPDEEE